MAVGRDYMLRRPAGPSRPKVFLDQTVVPLVVNAAGWLEVALDRASARTRVRPALLLAGGAGVLSVLLLSLVRRRGSILGDADD